MPITIGPHRPQPEKELTRLLFQKEPLSRSLKGRPFEHEEYYEILFPDVIGSGGAPKRLTKPRRKGPDVLPGADGDQETPGTAILHLLNDGFQTGIRPQVVSNTVVPTPAVALAPTGAASLAQQQQQRPTQTAIPPRTSIASTSALTPPDETGPLTRKRLLPVADGAAGAAGAAGDKRRRTGNNNYIDLTHPAQANNPSAVALRADGIAVLAEALAKTMAAAAAPRWPEQAMDIFFRDFSDEDIELQVLIAEKVLTDPNKAVMFVKMPVALRKQWVGRLREVHNRLGN